MKLRSTIALFLACVLPAFAEPAADKTYSIKYHRRAEVGDIFDLHSTIKIVRKPIAPTKRDDLLPEDHGVNEDEEDPSPVDVVGDLKAKMEVLAIDSNGSPKEFVLVLKSLTRNGDENVSSEGKQIHVKRTPETVEYHEHPMGEEPEVLDEDVSKFLDLFIEKLNDADATDDDVFRSNKPRKLGDKWEVDYDALDNITAGEQITLDRKQTSMFVTLKEVTGKEKSAALVVNIEGKLKYKKMPLHPHLELIEATSTLHATYIVPEDKTSKSNETKMELEFVIKAKRKSDNKEVKFKDVLNRTTSVTLAKAKQ